jgi:tRNA-specific 2-thiouridylase
MSGGVDSSVAAGLLVREGYDVVGCFMRLGSPGETLDSPTPFDSAGISCDPRAIKVGHQGCCSINDAMDARLVAAALGVPLYVVNFKKDFGRIIDYFVDEYAAGRTPNPCVRCNDWLKFGKLHRYAEQIGAEYVASGHYARVDRTSAEPRLLCGVDHDKDQSYVLFGVPREQLAHMLLPIGEMKKSDVRALAKELGLPTFDKPDSQEICFVPDNDYAGLVERRRPELAKEGVIVDEQGAVVGEHAGQHRFTIGQRRGLGVSGAFPLFVLGKDPSSNTVMVGRRERLAVKSCIASEANWLVVETAFGNRQPATAGGVGRLGYSSPANVECRMPFADSWLPVLAKYRYNTDPVPARVRVLTGNDAAVTPSGRTGRFEVEFDQPQLAVAPGQAIVLYHAAEPDVVMGGGWIAAAST